MRQAFSMIGIGTFLFISVSAGAQEKGKSPALPPINPAVARLSQTIHGLDGAGFAIAYGENSDLLFAACENGTIQGWKKDVLIGIRSGSGSANRLRGHQGPILRLAWNGGPVLASLGSDHKILLWSVKEGTVLKSFDTQGNLRALAMSPDGNKLAGAGEDRAVQLWDLPEGKAREKLNDHKDWVSALAYSPDGKWLASGDYSGKVTLWDAAEGKKVRDVTPLPMPIPKDLPDPVPVQSLAFSPDTKFLVVGSDNGLVQMVGVGDGKLVRRFPGHTSAVTGLAFHPTGNLLVSASKDRTVRLWNPANGQAIKTLEGHEAWIEGVVFTSQGTRLASVSADQTVRLWDLTELKK